MAEAKWQKGHKEKMELEEKKNKLLSEIEVLEKEWNELIVATTELRKEIKVHGGDYDEITAERIKTVNCLDEKFIKLKEDNNSELKKEVNLSTRLNNLNSSIQKAEENIKNKELEKQKTEKEINELSLELKKLQLQTQEQVDEKRKNLKKIDDELTEKREELKLINRTLEQEKEYILRENRLLSIRRSDLEIYEARMRKKYPNETFVLKPDANFAKN